MLAVALARGREADLEALEEAAGLLEELIADAETPEIELARIHRNLGSVSLDLARLGLAPEFNYRRGVLHYERSLRRDASDQLLAASISAQIGHALIGLAGLDLNSNRRTHLIRARRYLHSALTVFSVDEYPEEHGEIVHALEGTSASEVSTRVPIVEAARRGDALRVRMLIDGGIDVNATDVEGCSALHAAVSEGHIESAKMLLAAGADPRMRDRCRFTLLHWAVFSDAPNLLELSRFGEGVDPHDDDKRTPLSWAAALGLCESATWLIAEGADLNSPDASGWTPLHHAVAGDQPRLVRLLLDAGADRGAINASGETALALGTRLGEREAISALIV